MGLTQPRVNELIQGCRQTTLTLIPNVLRMKLLPSPQNTINMNEPHQAQVNSGGTQPARGTTVLVLGILSLIICALLGPFAWLMGKGDLEKMDQGAMDPSERDLTKAGMICGMISTILLALGLVWILFVGLAAFGSAAM